MPVCVVVLTMLLVLAACSADFIVLIIVAATRIVVVDDTGSRFVSEMTTGVNRGNDVMKVMCRRLSAQPMRGLGADWRIDKWRIVVAVVGSGIGEHMDVASRRDGVAIMGTS